MSLDVPEVREKSLLIFHLEQRNSFALQIINGIKVFP